MQFHIVYSQGIIPEKATYATAGKSPPVFKWSWSHDSVREEGVEAKNFVTSIQSVAVANSQTMMFVRTFQFDWFLHSDICSCILLHYTIDLIPIGFMCLQCNYR
jgi:hypothetical protein